MRALKDPVPNVRFTVAKIFHKVKGNIDAGILNSQIMPGLKELAGDSDRDVQYFASAALNDI